MSATPSSESRPPPVKKLKQTKFSFHTTIQLDLLTSSMSHRKDDSDQEETTWTKILHVPWSVFVTSKGSLVSCVCNVSCVLLLFENFHELRAHTPSAPLNKKSFLSL